MGNRRPHDLTHSRSVDERRGLIADAYRDGKQFRADAAGRRKIIAGLNISAVRRLTGPHGEPNSSVESQSTRVGVHLSQIGDFRATRAIVSPLKINRITTDGCTCRNRFREAGGTVNPTRTPNEVDAAGSASQLQSVVGGKGKHVAVPVNVGGL